MKKRIGIYIRPEELKQIKKNAIDSDMSMSDFLVTAGTAGYQQQKFTVETASAGSAIKK